VPPVDSAQDMRGEMLAAMAAMGVAVEKHHHEVARQHDSASSSRPRHRRRPSADLQIAIHQVANSYGRRRPSCPSRSMATTAPECMCTSRSGKRQAVFAGDKYAGLSQECLWYIAHHQARQGAQRLHQPSTNSYKRLVPGFEAPVLLAYSSRNRSASAHPLCDQPEGEARRGSLPDPTANPYLAFSAMLMAGLDGIPTRSIRAKPPTRISMICLRRN